MEHLRFAQTNRGSRSFCISGSQGYHPWFSHWISLKPGISKEDHYHSLFFHAGDAVKSEHEAAFDKLVPALPEPTSLDDILSDLRLNLQAFPNAMLGEVGLDRSFRVALDYHASPRELTPFTIPLDHQLGVLEAQLDLAVDLRRNVSLHSVKSQMATVELLERMSKKHGNKWNAISVDLHSCGLSASTWRDIEKKYSNVYLSLSTVINSRSANHRSLIAACNPDRILVESDYNDVTKCTEQMWDMILTVADVKGWHVEDAWEESVEENEWGVVRKLEKNWNDFVRGGHAPMKPRANHRTRQMNRAEEGWISEDSDR